MWPLASTPSRRALLQSASALGLLALPGLDLLAGEPGARAGDDRILLVVQLTGGNDGLNTIVPWRDDAYRRERPRLAIPEAQLLALEGSDLALHPALAALRPAWDDGDWAIVNGVGYPQPDRSHFRSLDIWHSARREELLGDDPVAPSSGWLGRCIEAERSAVHIGDGRQPLALAGPRPVPSLGDLDALARLSDREGSRSLAVLEAGHAAVRDTTALEATRALGRETLQRLDRLLALSRRSTPVEYPGDPLGKRLRLAGQLISGGLDARTYYLTHDGFDTHANQLDAHAGLLDSLARGLAAFRAHLSGSDAWRRVTVLVFSEFGRRLAENGSRGSDHGAAGPAFLLGGRVRGGVHGAHPSLTDLEDGDPRHHTDFRRIYATLLREVLDADPEQVLGERFAPLPLLG